MISSSYQIFFPGWNDVDLGGVNWLDEFYFVYCTVQKFKINLQYYICYELAFLLTKESDK